MKPRFSSSRTSLLRSTPKNSQCFCGFQQALVGCLPADGSQLGRNWLFVLCPTSLSTCRLRTPASGWLTFLPTKIKKIWRRSFDWPLLPRNLLHWVKKFVLPHRSWYWLCVTNLDKQFTLTWQCFTVLYSILPSPEVQDVECHGAMDLFHASQWTTKRSRSSEVIPLLPSCDSCGSCHLGGHWVAGAQGQQLVNATQKAAAKYGKVMESQQTRGLVLSHAFPRFFVHP